MEGSGQGTRAQRTGQQGIADAVRWQFHSTGTRRVRALARNGMRAVRWPAALAPRHKRNQIRRQIHPRCSISGRSWPNTAGCLIGLVALAETVTATVV
jgi:hypothetical protein